MSIFNLNKALKSDPSSIVQSGSSNEAFSQEDIDMVAREQAKLNLRDKISPGDNPIPGNTRFAYPKDKLPGLSDILREATYEDAIKQSFMDPGINYMDYKALQSDSPITQQGYNGQTFSAPTIAAGGVVFPYNIIEKRERARAENERKEAIERVSLDYGIQEVKDVASNKIFIEKQKEYYDGLAQKVADEKFGGNIGKAYQYLNKEKNTLAISGLQWKNFKEGFNAAYDNYIKMKADPSSMGTSEYSKNNKEFMAGFEQLLHGDINPDSPETMSKLSKFVTDFNKRATINSLATEATKVFKDAYSVDLEELAKTNDYDVQAIVKKLDLSDDALEGVWNRIGGNDEDYTPEEKKLFKAAFRDSFERKIISDFKIAGKTNMDAIFAKSRAEAAAKKAEKTSAYTVTPSSTIEYSNVSTGVANNMKVLNVVGLPPDKKVQISLQQDPDTKIQAIDKTTGEFITTQKDTDFEPKNTYVAFVSNKNLYKTDPNTGQLTDEILIEAGKPITADQQQLCERLQDSDGLQLRRVRYVQGTMTEKSEDAEARIPRTVIAPWDQVGGQLGTIYPELDNFIQDVDSKYNNKAVIASASEWNKKFGKNATKAQLQASFPEYIWIEGKPGAYNDDLLNTK